MKRRIVRPIGAMTARAPSGWLAWPPSTVEGAEMDDYPFLEIVWTLFVFFGLVLFVWVAIIVLVDNFARSDHSGWAKAGWAALILFLPVIGILVYMAVRPSTSVVAMHGVRHHEPSASAAEEIERLHRLKTEGAITDAEYNKLKLQRIA
jgi:hypothetical protein